MEIFIPVILGFAITLAIGPFLIPFLRRLKMGQTEREEGVQSHLKKAGTPTMGGIMILVSVTVVSVIFSFSYPRILPVLFLTLGFGAIGFVDDYLKVVLRRSDGFLPKQKMLAELIVTTIFLIIILVNKDPGLEMVMPFSGGESADIGWLAIPVLYIAVLATVNGVNFTDGLDGLASSVTAAVAVFFTAVSVLKNTGLAPIGCAMVGALLAFLCYNVFPAKIFMGDTGSLALGGFVAGMAYMQNMPFFILLVGIIYAVELVSVVLQVSYFKATHGKRIFKMTPIHHHFELCGWSEPRITAVFTIITIIMCCVGFVAV